MNSINVEIIDVVENGAQSAKGNAYKFLQVTYRGTYQGKPKVDAKKLFDFSCDKEVYETLKAAEKGESFNIITNKNDKGYLDWVEISRQDGGVPAEKGAAPMAAGPKAAAYAEQDERRQKLIVRQSALKAAVDFLNATSNLMDNEESVEHITSVAEIFEGWVNRE